MAKPIPVDHKDIGLHTFLKAVRPFRGLSDREISALAALAKRLEFNAGEYIIQAGDMGDALFIIEEGLCSLEIAGRTVKRLNPGDLFGEIAVIDTLPRTASVRAAQTCRLLSFQAGDLENEKKINPSSYIKILKALARQITSYVRSGDDLYQEMDCLLVQDGGCAPGYDSVTGFLTYFLEEAGHQVFMAREGYKSLVSGQAGDFCCLINDQALYQKMENLPGGYFYPAPARSPRGQLPDRTLSGISEAGKSKIGRPKSDCPADSYPDRNRGQWDLQRPQGLKSASAGFRQGFFYPGDH